MSAVPNGTRVVTPGAWNATSAATLRAVVSPSVNDSVMSRSVVIPGVPAPVSRWISTRTSLASAGSPSRLIRSDDSVTFSVES